MNKLVLVALATLTVGSVFARCGEKACHVKKQCEKPVVNCAPKPKCVKRCVVEKCVEPRKVCETNCYYECPTDCETASGEYVPVSKDVTKKGSSNKRMRTNEAY